MTVEKDGKVECPSCGRCYLLNYDGSMRQHECRQPVETVVELRSGGSFVIQQQFSIMRLGADERELVNAIADAIYEYRRRAPVVGHVHSLTSEQHLDR